MWLIQFCFSKTAIGKIEIKVKLIWAVIAAAVDYLEAHWLAFQ
jgi:hypothetical protein